jgi:type I restriction enzyme S subunit
LAFFERSKVGTTVIHLGKSDIDTFRVSIPKDRKILKVFTDNINPLLEKIIGNALENQSLKQTRDYLLPKLISGEIRVKEAHKAVKELI